MIYTLNPFHFVFIETEPKTYYLSVLQLVHIPSMTISSTLTRLQGCLSINELFNASFDAMHLIRRMKYYHLPCKQHMMDQDVNFLPNVVILYWTLFFATRYDQIYSSLNNIQSSMRLQRSLHLCW